jgi:hypothetical protein
LLTEIFSTLILGLLIGFTERTTLTVPPDAHAALTAHTTPAGILHASIVTLVPQAFPPQEHPPCPRP